jgi:hypothetical protein
MTQVALRQFTLYDKKTGRITGWMTTSGGGTCETEDIGQFPGVFKGAEHYVTFAGGKPTIEKRPEMPVTVDRTQIAAGGTDHAKFDNVPLGARVSVDGASQDYALPPLIFAASDAGTYTLRLTCFPYLDREFKIVAT